MGVDFICAYVMFPGEPHWADGQAAIDRLADLPAAEWPPTYGELVYGQPIIDDPSDEAGCDKETAVSDLIDALDTLKDPPSEIAVIDLGAYTLYLTGGDEYTFFERLEESGVFAAMGAVYKIPPVSPSV